MEIIILFETFIIIGFIVAVDFLHKEIKKVNEYCQNLTEINENLNKEIKYLSKVNKTLNEGLDFYTKKHKAL